MSIKEGLYLVNGTPYDVKSCRFETTGRFENLLLGRAILVGKDQKVFFAARYFSEPRICVEGELFGSIDEATLTSVAEEDRKDLEILLRNISGVEEVRFEATPEANPIDIPQILDKLRLWR